MTAQGEGLRRLLGVGAALVVLSSAACAYIAVSPPPRPPAARKALVSAVITPNPPRPGSDGEAANRIEATPLTDAGEGDAGGGEAEAGRVHVVRGGETLFGIARSYGVEVFAFADYNGLSAPFAIYAGQRLAVPPQSARPAPASPSGDEEPPVVASLPAVTQPLPAPPGRSGHGFIWPVQGKILSTFGPKARGLRNDGINIAASRGAPVRAVDNGVVAYAGNELRGFGNMILIKHADGWVSTYAHNDRLLVGRGDRVRRGQVIARAGSSGRADAPQLHFELRKGTTPVDPLAYLPRLGT
jgi:murein DD-endopeptidase MepM/ murein hydrolase activator NlpD